MLYRLICNSNLTQILDKSCFITKVWGVLRVKSSVWRNKKRTLWKKWTSEERRGILQTLSTGISAQEGHENAGDALANYNVLWY